MEVCTRERGSERDAVKQKERESSEWKTTHRDQELSFMAAFAQKQNLHARIKIK